MLIWNVVNTTFRNVVNKVLESQYKFVCKTPLVFGDLKSALCLFIFTILFGYLLLKRHLQTICFNSEQFIQIFEKIELYWNRIDRNTKKKQLENTCSRFERIWAKAKAFVWQFLVNWKWWSFLMDSNQFSKMDFFNVWSNIKWNRLKKHPHGLLHVQVAIEFMQLILVAHGFLCEKVFFKSNFGAERFWTFSKSFWRIQTAKLDFNVRHGESLQFNSSKKVRTN